MTTEFFLEIAKLKPGLAFFRDDAFADDSARTNVQQAFMMLTRMAFRSPCTLIFALVMAFRKSARLSLVFLAVLPVLVGMLLARLLSDAAGQGEELRSAFGLSALPGLSPLVYLLAAAVVLCLIALACAFYLRALGRRSPLRLLQEKER